MTSALSPPTPTEAANASVQRGRRIQAALKQLLDRVAGARDALPHLAALENALGLEGVDAIERASPRGLSKIHTQLRVLPLVADDVVLQDLLARVQNALRRHAAARSTTHQLTPFDPTSTVVILEASHSDFMNALNDARGAH